MTKKMTVLLALILAFVFVFAACNSDNGDSADPTKAPAAKTAAAKTDAPEPAKQEPTELSMFYQEAGQNFPDGWDHMDNDYINFICELANVKIVDLICPAYSDTATKFNLMMASAEIPDLVERADTRAMKQAGEDGAFLEMEPIIRNSAIISQFYDDVQIATMKSGDGKVYTLLNLPGTYDYTAMAVRIDLLEEIEKDIPTTTDELYEALAALKAIYPDSTPMVCRGAVWAWLHPIFMPFESTHNGTGWQYYPEDGEYRNTFEGTDIVEAVTYGNKLYAEGLLDPEFITTGSSEYGEKITAESNKTMVISRNQGSVRIYMQQLINSGQHEAVYIPVPFVSAPGHDYGGYRYEQATGFYCYGINANAEGDILDGTVRFIEALYHEDVKTMGLYGFEGVDFQYIDDEPTPIYPAAFEHAHRTMYSWIYIQDKEKLSYQYKEMVYAADVLTDEKKAEIVKTYNDQKASNDEMIIGKRGYNPTSLVPPLTEDITNRRNECREAQKALLAQAIMGNLSIADFTAQKDAIWEDYTDVTDAYNQKVADAKAEFGIDNYGFSN